MKSHKYAIHHGVSEIMSSM